MIAAAIWLALLLPPWALLPLAVAAHRRAAPGPQTAEATRAALARAQRDRWLP